MPLDPISAYKSIAAGSFKTGTAQTLGGAGPAAGAATGPSFMDTFRETAADAVSSLKQGERAAMGGLSGKTQVHEVVTALTDAEITIQAATAIREKVVGAYQELMRMPV